MSASQGSASRAAPYLVLAIALAAVSNGAILARLAEAPVLAIAAWRVGLAFLAVLPLAAWAARGTAIDRRGLRFAAGAGLLLALHFATWITSLQHTTIARSVLFVCTSPIWVALLLSLAGRGLPSRATTAALLLAVAGAGIVAGGAARDAGSIGGDLLALAGGVAMAGYFLLSREAQATLPFPAYLGVAYGVAAGALWAGVLATGTQFAGFGAGTWWALGAMAVVSQLVGHSGYNWALRYLSPLFVAIVSVGEPVLASMLGWWLLDEAVHGRTALGGLLILAGIALAALATRTRG